jgi:hypothetical protein
VYARLLHLIETSEKIDDNHFGEIQALRQASEHTLLDEGLIHE